MIIGKTGDGKSTLTNVLAAACGHHANAAVSSGASSHTHDPHVVSLGDGKIVDNPGLMDSGGFEVDEVNIKKIVEQCRSLVKVNSFLLVLNEQVWPRGRVTVTRGNFEDTCTASLKLLYTYTSKSLCCIVARLQVVQVVSITLVFGVCVYIPASDELASEGRMMLCYAGSSI
jgi:hypothetical protein